MANPVYRSSNLLQSILSSRLGGVLARGWMEKPILYLLQYWFFPLSRLWAAARKANGDVDQFFAAVPMEPVESEREKIQGLLDVFEIKRHQIVETEGRWRQLFFGRQDSSETQLAGLEKMRLAHRNEYNATRQTFRPLRKYVKSSVYDCFASPEQARQLFGEDPEQDEAAFERLEEMPQVNVSRSIDKRFSTDFWISFDTPSERLGDTVYARVLEPKGVINPPTLIFGHGIGVEFDHWRNLLDIVKYLPQLGIRVIRPESPWHGRRVPDGFYGGEYFLSTAPVGGFNFFTAQHQEWTVLMDWARQTSSGALAIGGSSMGAQSAQMTAIRASSWPKELQPDALFLMTHCSHLWEVALDGDLADIWNLHNPLKKLGWNRKTTEQWMHRLDPLGDPCMPPERIVSVLGRNDGITPYHSGRRMQKRWELPEENCFVWPCGHFEVPMRMLSQRQPLTRLVDILASI